MGMIVAVRPWPLLDVDHPLLAWMEQAGLTSPKKIVFDNPSSTSRNRLMVPTRVKGPANLCGSSSGASASACHGWLHEQAGLS